jgi:putative transposase
MVRYRRNLLAGGTYFFTVTVLDRRSTILVDNINALRSAFRVARRERPFAIDAIAVLPEHLHVVMTLPPGDAEYSGRWRKIKSLFSRRVANNLGLTVNARGEYPLWQPRFWEHTIRDDGDYERHVKYVHYNPIKHGLVSRIRDWPYSSFHCYVRHGIFPRDWAGDASGVSQGYGERIS